MLAVALAALPAFAQETTIKVPQGSGVFPTVGQVNCLEELGTGRLCAATYQCSEGSGRLWGDLANHDGRRAINQDSPVARGRDCTITVDGRAEVRWLTAYAPRGRDSELAGLTTQATTQVEASSEPWTVSYTKSVRIYTGQGNVPRVFPYTVDIATMDIVTVRWQYDAANDTRTRSGTFIAALHCPPPFAPTEANAIRFTTGDSNTHTLSLILPKEDYDELRSGGVWGLTYRCWLRVNARLDDEDQAEYSAKLPVDVTTTSVTY